MIQIFWAKARAHVRSTEYLTAHMSRIVAIGFDFSPEWAGLSKTAVFTDGVTTVDVLESEWTDGVATHIPHEVLTTAGRRVRVGVYGTDGENVVLPTVWADLGTVLRGADPSGDESTDPTLPVWAQLQKQLEGLGVSPEEVEAAVEAYLTKNPVEAPVTSVNGKTGEVTLRANDVSAVAGGTCHYWNAKVSAETYKSGFDTDVVGMYVNRNADVVVCSTSIQATNGTWLVAPLLVRYAQDTGSTGYQVHVYGNDANGKSFTAEIDLRYYTLTNPEEVPSVSTVNGAVGDVVTQKIVTLTYNDDGTVKASATATEINEWMSKGYSVVMALAESALPLGYASGEWVEFMSTYVGVDGIPFASVLTVGVDKDGKVVFRYGDDQNKYDLDGLIPLLPYDRETVADLLKTVITVTEDAGGNASCDVKFADITAALDAGLTVMCKLESKARDTTTTYAFARAGYGYVTFADAAELIDGDDALDSIVSRGGVTIYANDSVEVHGERGVEFSQFATAEAVKAAQTTADAAKTAAAIAQTTADEAKTAAATAQTTANEAKTAAANAAQKSDIPTKLPAPNALTLTGAVEATYDGSTPVTVDIPAGGGSDPSLGITGATVGQTVKITAVDEDGKPTAWEAADYAENWELIAEADAEEDVTGFTVQFPHVCRKIRVALYAKMKFSDGSEGSGFSRISAEIKFETPAVTESESRPFYILNELSSMSNFMWTMIELDASPPFVTGTAYALRGMSTGRTSEPVCAAIESRNISGIGLFPNYKFVSGVGSVGRFEAGSKVLVYGVRA